MMFKSSSRVAVLDLTHGGTVIAKKLKKIVREVTAIDVYKTLSMGELEALESEGIRTSTDALNAVDFDLIIAPVHLDTNYPMLVDAVKNNIPVLSHHAAVGELLSRHKLNDKILVEITGTKAKTSTSFLLAEILSKKKKVITHTSRGVEDRSTRKVIKKGLSITPASILSVLDTIGNDFDILLSEISLGGTGCADIGIITTIVNDYKIANNTRLASDAKRQMILNAKPESTLVINNDALRFFGACRRDVRIISFTESIDASCNVYYENENTIAFFFGKKHGRIHIPKAEGYDMSAYKTAFACAAAAALAMDIDASIIEKALSQFSGAEGRMKITSLDGIKLIDNSNSGLDIRNAKKALQFAQAQGGRIVMVLGEEAKEVCEGLDPKGVEGFISKHSGELYALVLVGERMKPLVNGNNIYYAENLSNGIELAKKLAQKKDTILSCVKCFR